MDQVARALLPAASALARNLSPAQLTQRLG
jgi:hypothetical protein